MGPISPIGLIVTAGIRRIPAGPACRAWRCRVCGPPREARANRTYRTYKTYRTWRWSKDANKRVAQRSLGFMGPISPMGPIVTAGGSRNPRAWRCRVCGRPREAPANRTYRTYKTNRTGRWSKDANQRVAQRLSGAYGSHKSYRSYCDGGHSTNTRRSRVPGVALSRMRATARSTSE